MPPTLAQLLNWPETVVNDVKRCGALEQLSANLSNLVLTSSYSGMGSAEVVLQLLAWQVRDRLSTSTLSKTSVEQRLEKMPS